MSKEERRKERQEIYQSKRWKDLRNLMMQEHPLCQDCLKEGKIVPAQEVHHKLSCFVKGLTPEEKERRAFDPNNLVCLCRECHWRRHHPEGIIQDKIKKYSE